MGGVRSPISLHGRTARQDLLVPNDRSADKVVQPGKLPIHIRVPALEHFVLMSCAHAAPGLFAVAAVELRHNIPFCLNSYFDILTRHLLTILQLMLTFS